MLDAETTAMNTTETATASTAIFAWVLRLALIREWFHGASPSVMRRSSAALFPPDVAIVSSVLLLVKLLNSLRSCALNGEEFPHG